MSLLMDNWSFQTLGELLENGLSPDDADAVVIKRGSDTHRVAPVSEAGVQLETLFALLVDVILRDGVVVDSAFSYTWRTHDEVLAPLKRNGLLAPRDFSQDMDKVRGPTPLLVNELCVTDSLRRAQRENEKSWAEKKIPSDPYLSSVLWGTAGMLSRSFVFRLPYSPHPLRRRMLEQTSMASPRVDVVADTLTSLNEKRLRLFATGGLGKSHRQANVVLPSVAIDVLNDASSVADLLPVAIQLRDKHKMLREYLKEIQIAVDDEKPDAIAKHRRNLAAISRDLDRAVGEDANSAKLSVKIGFSGIDASINSLSLDAVRSKFGVRAALNKQLFAERGERALRKVLAMFGEKSSRMEYALQKHFTDRGDFE